MKIFHWKLVSAAAAIVCPLVASAVVLEPSGQGQVLIYPYYSVQDGNQTLLSVVNHDRSGKAVKVHIREGRNGRSVATFNLYLAEFDVWTAALFKASDGIPGLLTADHSCTVPAIQTSTTLPQLPDGRRYLPLSNADYSGTRADGGSTAFERAGSGYIELVEMGSLVDSSDSDDYSTQINGVPLSCAQLVGAWADGGYWSRNAGTDLAAPTGKLSGALSLLQVDQGTAYTVSATALEQFSVIVQHTAPSSATPDLAAAVTDPARESVESLVLTGGKFVRSRWPQAQAIDAVSAVLARATVQAEYSVEPALSAATDWYISQPTRRHYTDPALVTVAVPPYTVRFSAGQGCEVLTKKIYNRESYRPVGFMEPAPPGGTEACLCSATQVLPVNRPLPDPLPASVCATTPLSTTFGGTVLERGYIDLGLSGNGHRSRTARDGESYEGLPVLGFTTVRYRNNAARPGEIGLYGTTRSHRGTSECRRNNVDCSP